MYNQSYPFMKIMTPPPPQTKPPHPPMKPYPAEGKMVENGFMIIDSIPFIYDNTHVTYGQRVIVSDNVNTELYQVKDPYRLNLNAKFDMTTDINTNTVLQHYLKEFISTHASELNGVLPIVRNHIKFTINYSISDSHGCLISDGSKSITINDSQYHATEIDDYFLNTHKGLFDIMIPPITYPGMYKFTIHNVSAYVDVLDTDNHMTDTRNPYYQFTENNTKIAIQHDTIVNDEVTDNTLLIGVCYVNKSFLFDSNSVKNIIVSFTSYLATLISFSNTFGIWEAFNSEKVDIDAFITLQKQVESLTKDIKTLSKQLVSLDKSKVDAVEGKGLSENDYTNEDKSKLESLVKSGEIIFKPTSSDFPVIGNADTLYIATQEELSYIWNSELSEYKNIDKS